MDPSKGPRRLALLIDADNAQPAVIDELLAEVARFGSATVKRIYGDWTSPRHGQWKRRLLKHSIQPVQQFAYTTGKNATDSALIIDAMDLLYTGRFDGFCLMSSDSDFTRLAQRIREEGLLVYGFGEKKTPEAFVAACDKFIYTEVLRGDDKSDGKREEEARGAEADIEAADLGPQKNQPLPPPDAVQLISKAIAEADDDDGWAALATVGNYINQLRPDFDPRLFGFKKLSSLVRSFPKRFELREQALANSDTRVLYVRKR